MLIPVVLAILLTPWFWAFPVPNNLFKLDIQGDIKTAREIATWERGKTESRLNKVFVNWPMEFVNNRLTIVMENLDIGNYFFKGHPRERVGIEEKQKFFAFQLVLFLIGLTNPEIKKYKNFLITYTLFILLISFIFKWRTYEDTLPFSIPILLIIALGIRQIIKRYAKK